MKGLKEHGNLDCPTDLHLRVLASVAAGYSYSRISQIEHVSSRTARRMIADLKRHAGVDNPVALGAQAAWRGWLNRSPGTRGGGELAPPIPIARLHG